MQRKIMPLVALVFLIVALWPNSGSLYELTGEEKLPGQLRGVIHWMHSAIRPQPDHAFDAEINYALCWRGSLWNEYVLRAGSVA